MRLRNGAVKVKRFFPLRKGRVCNSCKSLFVRELGWLKILLYSNGYLGGEKYTFYCSVCGPKLGMDEYCIRTRCGRCPLKVTCLGKPL